MKRTAMPIYSVGHSTRTLAELGAMLTAHGIDTLVDLRSIRRSRTNPQFNEARLKSYLARKAIRYRVIAALGGRRPKAKPPLKHPNDAWQNSAFRNFADHAETAEFRAGLAELIALAKTHTVAIMCSEAVWWRCHRRIVTDHLLAHRVPVVHLMSQRATTVATPTLFAVIRRGRVHYPAPRSE
ncbi:MAG TPA: DUF488 domain-containing protein [Kofleriaceae bacterium]|jgi:uncharacterized protein (DUF488 family)|nr:DUF488 domain-containing protein [Kofleriaceae bacterium]